MHKRHVPKRCRGMSSVQIYSFHCFVSISSIPVQANPPSHLSTFPPCSPSPHACRLRASVVCKNITWLTFKLTQSQLLEHWKPARAHTHYWTNTRTHNIHWHTHGAIRVSVCRTRARLKSHCTNKQWKCFLVVSKWSRNDTKKKKMVKKRYWKAWRIFLVREILVGSVYWGKRLGKAW